jgi:hypothetical protein
MTVRPAWVPPAAVEPERAVEQSRWRASPCRRTPAPGTSPMASRIVARIEKAAGISVLQATMAYPDDASKLQDIFFPIRLDALITDIGGPMLGDQVGRSMSPCALAASWSPIPR